MDQIFIVIDTILISFYRVTGVAFLDFLLGTFVLAFACVVVGEYTKAAAFLINHEQIDKISHDISHYQTLSFDALAARHKTAYSAANKIANEAFGRSFFIQVALSAAGLWPLFLALLWMKGRFGDVDFEILYTDTTVGYLWPFVALYVGSVLIFSRFKHKLPLLDKIKPILETYQETSAKPAPAKS
jgi:hypothetical protein